MRILFAGGGTMGSVSPLLAIHSELKKQGVAVEALWLGTLSGPERAVIEKQGIAFTAIAAAKFRRYVDWRTVVLPLTVPWSVLRARSILKHFQPQVVLSAGSFVAVPAVLAAWTLGIPTLVHQQDIVPSLTNRMLAPFATAITITFPTSQRMFPKHKTTITGNPVRPDLAIADRAVAYQRFHFASDVPTVLVLGGGTGAAALNRLVWDALSELLQFCQVIHLTGIGKMAVVPEHPRYRAFEFVDEDMAYAYTIADLVVSRAGMGALSELAVLGKPAIIVPIPGSHQEQNAMAFAKSNAAIFLPQPGLTANDFAAQVQKTLNDRVLLSNLSRNVSAMLPKNAVQALADAARRIAREK